MLQVLISGFDAFGKEEINPSFLAVHNLPDQIKGAKLIKLELATVYQTGFETLKQAIKKQQPDIVIAVGQAGGREKISLEKYGFNWLDFKIADNQGNIIKNQFIDKQLPLKLESSLPVDYLLEKLSTKNIPLEISYRAGGFICNEVLFRLLDYTMTYNTNLLAGFIHVPYELSQIKDKPNQFGMALNEITMALEMIIQETINYLNSIKVAKKF